MIGNELEQGVEKSFQSYLTEFRDEESEKVINETLAQNSPNVNIDKTKNEYIGKILDSSSPKNMSIIYEKYFGKKNKNISYSSILTPSTQSNHFILNSPLKNVQLSGSNKKFKIILYHMNLEKSMPVFLF
jgi:hypothetical protein